MIQRFSLYLVWVQQESCTAEGGQVSERGGGLTGDKL